MLPGRGLRGGPTGALEPAWRRDLVPGRGRGPRPGADAALLPRRLAGSGGVPAPRGPAAFRSAVDQLPAGARCAVRAAAPGVVPAYPPAAYPLPGIDDAIPGAVPLALARRHRRAVPAVGGCPRAAGTRPPPFPPPPPRAAARPTPPPPPPPPPAHRRRRS